MVLSPKITAKSSALLLVDIQEKLFAKVHEKEQLFVRLLQLANALSLLQVPIFVTEQYPQGLGKTIDDLASFGQKFEKTAFSCLADDTIRSMLLSSEHSNWIVAGIESHVCILQTVEDLLRTDKRVYVVQDAISSRHLLNHQSALQEMRAMGACITTVETLLFRLLEDAKHPYFKEISQLIK